MQAEDVGLRERDLAIDGLEAGGLCTLARALSSRHEHTHAEGPAVACDDGADAAVAVDPERLAVELPPQRRLPPAAPHGLRLAGYVLRGGEDETPRELGRRHGRPAPDGHCDASLRAGAEIDVRNAAAGLRDQAEIGQALEQVAGDPRSLPDQHECLAAPKELGEPVHVLDRLAADGDVVPGERLEAGERRHRPLGVVGHDDPHAGLLARSPPETLMTASLSR